MDEHAGHDRDAEVGHIRERVGEVVLGTNSTAVGVKQKEM